VTGFVIYKRGDNKESCFRQFEGLDSWITEAYFRGQTHQEDCSYISDI